MPTLEEKMLLALASPLLTNVVGPLQVRNTTQIIAQFVVNDRTVGIGVGPTLAEANRAAANAVIAKMVDERPDLAPLIEEMRDNPGHPALRSGLAMKQDIIRRGKEEVRYENELHRLAMAYGSEDGDDTDDLP